MNDWIHEVLLFNSCGFIYVEPADNGHFKVFYTITEDAATLWHEQTLGDSEKEEHKSMPLDNKNTRSESTYRKFIYREQQI